MGLGWANNRCLKEVSVGTDKEWAAHTPGYVLGGLYTGVWLGSGGPF